ncbi:MAG: TatD family hydrolase [Acidilobaceae archaeon]
MIVYDIHCHLYEYNDEEIARLFEEDKNLRVVAVSDDRESLIRTVALGQAYPDRVIPCAGFHPWNLKRERGSTEAEEILRLAYRLDISCLGEIGLDAKFLSDHTLQIQKEILAKFLLLAREVPVFLVLHSPDAWKEVFLMLVEHDIDKAVFHWYTGSINLAQLIATRGYKISINPAVRVQEKHAQVAKSVPLDSIVLESDAPYDYKGLKLSPLMIRETLKFLAEVRRRSVEELLEIVRENSEKLIGRALV